METQQVILSWTAIKVLCETEDIYGPALVWPLQGGEATPKAILNAFQGDTFTFRRLPNEVIIETSEGVEISVHGTVGLNYCGDRATWKDRRTTAV